MTIVYLMMISLPDSELLELQGADALAFAQAQFINDIKALPDGGWQWSGWLTPKGRLVAFFAAIRTGADRLLLWLPAGGAEALRERLQRYVFRSKLTLRVAADWTALGVIGTEAGEPGNGFTLELPANDEGNARRLHLLPTAAVAAPAHDDEEAARIRWRLADLRLGLPYVGAGLANSEQFVPQWLSLDRLSAFSLSKGCYPGQEIVARMHYLGQSKRAAFRLSGRGAAPPAMARVLDAEGNGLGELVWTQADGDQWQALAVLTADKAETVAAIDGDGPANVHRLP